MPERLRCPLVVSLESRVLLAALAPYPLASVDPLDQSTTPPVFAGSGFAFVGGQSALYRSDGSTAGTFRFGTGFAEKLFNWDGTLYLRYYPTPGGASTLHALPPGATQPIRLTAP